MGATRPTFALAWTASLVPVLSGGALPRDYTDDRTMFWLIRLLDLGFGEHCLDVLRLLLRYAPADDLRLRPDGGRPSPVALAPERPRRHLNRRGRVRRFIS